MKCIYKYDLLRQWQHCLETAKSICNGNCNAALLVVSAGQSDHGQAANHRRQNLCVPRAKTNDVFCHLSASLSVLVIADVFVKMRPFEAFETNLSLKRTQSTATIRRF